MPHTLIPHLFSRELQNLVADFDCGDEPWAIPINEWISTELVFEDMESWGTRVWIYKRQVDDAVVGYGSLGTTSLKIRRERKEFSIIPMLGVALPYQRQPEDRKFRYSRQIMRHLLGEAAKMACPGGVCLSVHQNNGGAIALYKAFGFAPFGNPRMLPHPDGTEHIYA